MAKDLVLDVIAKKNSRQLSELADEFDRLAKMTDDAGHKMHDTGTFSQFLDDQISKTKTQVKELGDEFERTGDKDIFAKLRGSQSNLASLEKIKKDLSKALDDGAKEGGKALENAITSSGHKGIVQFTRNAAESIGEAFSGLGEAFMPALIISAVGAAPLIGAAINAGIITAVAGGGIATGIIAQLHDPQVQEATKQLGGDLKNALMGDTAAFKQPLIAAIGEIDHALTGLLGKIDFKTLAAEVQPLAVGLSGMISELGPGINDAIKASQPLINELMHDLPAIGTAISDFLSDLSSASPGAVEGLRTILNVIIGGIEVVGKFVQVLSDSYEQIIRFGDDASGLAQKLDSWVPGISQLTNLTHDLFHEIRFGTGDVTTLGRSLSDTGGDANLLANAMRAASTAFDDYFGKTMSAQEATIKFKQDLLAMKDAVDQNGTSLSSNTQKGLANQQMILQLIQDAERTRQAQIDMAGGANASADAIASANKQYQANIDMLYQMGVKLGFSKKQLDAIVGQYNVNVIYTETHVTRYSTITGTSNARGSTPGMRASGGPSAPGSFFIAGEHGPELVYSGTSGAYVVPPGRSGYATPVGATPQAASATRVLQPVTLVTPAGRVIWETMIEFALNTGRQPSDLWPADSR